MDVRIEAARYDAFSGAPSESSAVEFGTVGIVITGRKPGP